MYNELKKTEKQLDYNVIKQIKEHARKYDFVNDKKEFLKGVSAFEQKVILLNSKKPFEVLSYLDELDLKSTRLVLNELSKDEIIHIISLFSSKDKERFYANFSNLELVNQFIVFDKKADEHIEDLTLDRKVEILNASEKETIVASSKVYDSLDEKEKETLDYKLTDDSAINTLESTSAYKEDSEKVSETESKTSIVPEGKDILEKIVEDKITNEQEIQKEEIKEKQENKEQKEEQQNQKQEIKEEKVEDQLEKLSIVGDGNKKVSIVSNPDVVKQFQEEKEKTEQKEIQMIINRLSNQQQTVVEDLNKEKTI